MLSLLAVDIPSNPSISGCKRFEFNDPRRRRSLELVDDKVFMYGDVESEEEFSVE